MGCRYYQHNAINKTLEAIAAGEDQVLLTLATGTGKTFIAFRLRGVVSKSLESVREPNRRPRILFYKTVAADQAFKLLCF